jgi:hypothetical protein
LFKGEFMSCDWRCLATPFDVLAKTSRSYDTERKLTESAVSYILAPGNFRYIPGAQRFYRHQIPQPTAQPSSLPSFLAKTAWLLPTPDDYFSVSATESVAGNPEYRIEIRTSEKAGAQILLCLFHSSPSVTSRLLPKILNTP